MQKDLWVPASLIRLYALFLFLLGGALYGTIEVLWRGHTHYSMIFLGGICLVVLALCYSLRFPLWIRFALGVFLITALEYATGLYVNVLLGLKVWDYSSLPYSLHGQICLQYTVYWAALTAIAFLILPILQRLFFLPKRRITFPE